MVFQLEATSGDARTGVCRLPHGSFQTPLFMPVGTYGAVKAIAPAELRRIGVEVILCNAYHLYLRPGVEVVESLGGLRAFAAWDGLVLTDSGGYQIFSLKGMTKVDERGVEFRSHLDGSSHFLTPEECVQFQSRLGADIIMALDVCPPHDAPKAEVEGATERTGRWAERCRRVPLPDGRALFGIVQGGMYQELRKISAERICELDFSGN
ncbi:MAG: tRNA guanosine(34) transglycosylase Tgt, partial [bacterium]